MTLYESLFIAEVTVGTIFFVLLPIVSKLIESKEYVSKKILRYVKFVAIWFIIGILFLLVVINLDNYTPETISSGGLMLQGIASGMVFSAISVVFYIGYTLFRLVAKM